MLQLDLKTLLSSSLEFLFYIIGITLLDLFRFVQKQTFQYQQNKLV